MSENITINLTQPQEEITFSYTEQGEEIAFSFSEAARGPQGEPGSSVTVDQTIIDGSTNAVSGNAVFDGLALKAPIANPTFTGIVTAPRITGRCDGLEVFCKAGLAINAGQVVYVTGASGNNIIIGLAQANAEPTSSKTIGISESTLAHNATGYAITEGLMTVSISAPSAIEGDPIWLSSTTAGGMVFGLANKPSAPNHIVYLGVVTRKTGNTVVEIYVKIQNGAELDELADVAITSPVAGQALMRGASLWQNRSLVATDISNSTTAGRALLTAADAAAQRTSLGLGTAATTDSTAYATAAQGTDERVPTAAGLTSKFGTNKATIVNGDKVTILDSAASDAPKHVLWSLIVSTLTTAFNALYVGLTGNQTVAGEKTLSGQLELTGQAATNTTSAMTRALSDARYGRIFGASLTAGVNSDVNTTTYKTVTELSFALDVGNYYIDCILLHNGNASYATSGVKDKLDFTGTATASGTVYRVLDNATTTSSVPNSLVSKNTLVESAPSNRSQTTWRKGVLVVTAAGTLRVQIAQTSAVVGANTTLDTGSQLIIHRIP